MAAPERKKIKKPHDLLTEIVIINKKTVSYRNISREFQIHVNDAKRMMQDFYDKEKGGENGVYAVYMLSGTKKVHDKSQQKVKEPSPELNDDDVVMPSSPPPASSMDDEESWMFPKRDEQIVEQRAVVMCRDEHLEAVKEKFETIDAIHIHTLGPQRIRDWVQVSETGRALFRDYHSNQDPLVYNKIYGTIQNPKVTRRSGKRPPNIPMPAPKPAKVEVKQEPKAAAPVKTETKSATSSRPASRDTTKPTMKKEGSSLFKAFAKQSAAPKKQPGSGNTSDAHMSGMDDNDEGEDDDSMFLDADPAKKKRAADVQKEKDERKAKLQKMMDDDTEPAVPAVADAADMDVDPPAAKVGEDADAPEGDVEWSESDSEKPKADQGPKRRRGKRKVLKKKTVKDDEGFLVTREEEVWESFSEDEPAPKPAVAVKPAAKPAAPVKAPQKGPTKGAAAGAPGKKNIMSFFQKKT